MALRCRLFGHAFTYRFQQATCDRCPAINPDYVPPKPKKVKKLKHGFTPGQPRSTPTTAAVSKREDTRNSDDSFVNPASPFYASTMGSYDSGSSYCDSSSSGGFDGGGGSCDGGGGGGGD